MNGAEVWEGWCVAFLLDPDPLRGGQPVGVQYESSNGRVRAHVGSYSVSSRGASLHPFSSGPVDELRRRGREESAAWFERLFVVAVVCTGCSV